jgi:hypothetical protein
MLADPSVEVFVAEHSVMPGQSLATTIITAIKSCDLFLLLWSRNSQESEWVRHELGIATGNDKAIIPVLLGKDVSPPAFLKHIKYLSAEDDPNAALNRLRENVFKRASEAAKAQGLLWLLLGALFLWLLFVASQEQGTPRLPRKRREIVTRARKTDGDKPKRRNRG